MDAGYLCFARVHPAFMEQENMSIMQLEVSSYMEIFLLGYSFISRLHQGKFSKTRVSSMF